MKARLLIFILLGIALTGCKGEFNVKFDLPIEVNEHCRLVSYASNSKQGLMVETLVEIRNGQGEARVPTRNPTVVFLYRQSSSTLLAIFYAERGDVIKITGPNSDPAEWKIEGNSLSEQWSEWRIANKSALQSGDAEKINKAIADYVKGHEDSPLSAALLLLEYSRREDETGFVKLFESLKPGATKDSKLMAALSVGDMIEGSFPAGGNPKEMVLSGPTGNADTLRFNRGRPSFIFFKDSKSQNGRNDMDSLKKLMKSYPDSASRMIAVVTMEPDSTSWINSMRRDSLRNAAQGWMPLGVADSTAMALGVRRTPYFLVADSKGKRLYGGSDITKAMKAFRGAFGTTDK